MKKTKEIPFSQARQRLTSLVDEVEKSGRPVKILRHGKAVAVLMGVQEYAAKFEAHSGWRLAGSIAPVPGVDVEESLEELKRQRVRGRRRRAQAGEDV